MEKNRASEFEGVFCRGLGNVEFLKMLDNCWKTIDGPGQNLMMCYSKDLDSFYEGPDWKGVWTQNTYGMYTWTPLLPDTQFGMLDRAYNIWFAHQGNGQRKDYRDFVAPPGALMDCVSVDGRVAYRQGDGRWDIHDLFLEGTASGVLCKAEVLLASREISAIAEYLPKMELALDLIWSRRDEDNGLFKAGPAANLLAPNYAGTRMLDGSYANGYLSGLSVTFAAATDRVIELEKMAGHTDKAEEYIQRRHLAVQALLRHMLTDEGYLIKYLDLNGERHGVYGVDRWGYFCSAPNHDAIAHRIVDDVTARKIYAKIKSIPGLRPHGFICANYPGLDDTYENWGNREGLPGIWRAGYWVNGGAWLTCEARMIMAYYRLSAFEDIMRSVNRTIEGLRNNVCYDVMSDWGARPMYPNRRGGKIDTFGVPGAALRGLFEYWYSANSLALYLHLPNDVVSYEQLQPVRFGSKRLYLKVTGSGPVPVRAVCDGSLLPIAPGGPVLVPFSAVKQKSVVEIER